MSFSGRVTVFWQGQDGRLWLTFHRQRQGWALPSALAMGRLGSGPHATGQSTGVVDVFWRGINRAVGWRGAVAVPVGHVGGDLFAAGQSSGIIDVFWTDPAGSGLWHTRYLPGSSSWTIPDSLGGSLGGTGG